MGAYGGGGTLILSYTNGTDSWQLKLDVAAFDPATFAYTGVGPTFPIEVTLGDTFIGVGDIWAPYFDPSWTLSLEALYWYDGAEAHKLASLPVVGAVAGTSASPSSASPPIRRGFTFRDSMGKKQTVRLIGVATDTMATHRVVTRSTGGFDARDQAVVAYLSGARTGVVMFDGNGYPPSAYVWQRYELRPFERAAPAPPPSAALPTGRTGDILYHDNAGWRTLPIGGQGQDLQIGTVGTDVLPIWADSCCGTALPGQPPSPTGESTVNLTARCGAACAMATKLERMYYYLRTGLTASTTTLLSLGLQGIITWLIEGVSDGLATPFLFISQGAIRSLATLVLGWALSGPVGDLWPNLTSVDDTEILRTIYLSIPADPGPVTVTQDALDNWRHELKTSTALDLGPIGQQTLGLLIPTLSLAAWQQLAYFGSLDNKCVCPWDIPGNATRGGGLIGATIPRAIQGGGMIGINLPGALRGGAVLGAVGGYSVQGGAAIS